MRNLPGFSPMRLALVLTLGFFVLVVVVAVLATRSGGNDAQTASNVTTPAEKRPMKVVITDTERAQEEETDGGIAGLSIFKASGAITDRGTVTTYRGLTGANDSVILLRFVTKGKEGGITYLVKIDTTRRPVVSRWKIESATRAYKGLQGKGTETENATYTVHTLRGRVWR